MANGIDYKLIAVIILSILTSNADSVGTLRLCGRELADALALVCQGRGYNVAFKPQGDFIGGRYKRGIVDECCRRGCTLKTLESYCSEAGPTKKDTIQISKRSEMSSREIQTTIPSGRKDNGRLPLDNFIKHSISRKLRPLVLLYSNNFGDPSDQVTNLDLKALKSKQSASTKVEQKIMDDAFLNSGYSLGNEPLDTSEIMAEVVESHPQILSRAKRNLQGIAKPESRDSNFIISRLLPVINHQ